MAITEKEEWADRVSAFFCGHNPDQACQVCFDKAKRAYDVVMEGEGISEEDRIVSEFRGKIESEDLAMYVADLEKQVKAKSRHNRFSGWWVNIMTGLTLGGFLLAIGASVLLLAWAIKVLLELVFG